MTRWLLVLVPCLLILAYWPLWQAGFVYEDRRWLASSTTWPGWVVSRPLMRWSWFWQQHHTPSPQAFHGVNLGLHAVSAGLTGALGRRLGLSVLAAWLLTALYAVHPLPVESVAYAANRPELFAVIGVVGVITAGPVMA